MIYVIHAKSGRILERFGGMNAVIKAVEYAARRAAIIKAIAVRNGFAGNACEPIKIVEHSGRRLKKSQNLFERQTRRAPSGVYCRTQRAWWEVACLTLQATDHAWRNLQGLYPRLLRSSL
jgi:hypothetical protein